MRADEITEDALRAVIEPLIGDVEIVSIRITTADYDNMVGVGIKAIIKGSERGWSDRQPVALATPETFAAMFVGDVWDWLIAHEAQAQENGSP